MSSVGKKVLSIMLSLMMAIGTIAVGGDTIKAKAIGSYGVNLSSASYNSANLYKNRPQCTWYCWGRVHEKLGISLPNWGNATSWSNYARSAYTVDQNPSANSIMVEHYNPGHVLFVEKVENGYAYCTEGNYNGTDYHEEIINLSTYKRNGWSTSMNLPVEYIHLVKNETTPPTITNLRITERKSSGYKVECNISDASGIKDVSFPTWTIKNGQDDLIWHKGNFNNSTASIWINRSDHNNEKGTYITDIYVYDNCGNASSGRVAIEYEENAPKISNIVITNVSLSGYRVSCTVEDDTGIELVQFPTWTRNNDQDDLIWHDAKKSGNTYYYDVKVSEHKNEKGLYITHLYAWDLCGNVTSEGITIEIDNYTLNYNANGGSNPPVSQTGCGYITLSSTTPARNGYTFIHWNTKSDGTGISYAPGATLSLSKNTTLYAVWKMNTYTLTYNANGGSNKPANQTGNGKITLSGTTPTRPGYTFKCWNTKSNGTGTSYAPGSTYNLTGNVTLYAMWQIQPEINIRNFTPSRSEKFKTSITFTAETSNVPNGAKVHWFINGEDAGEGERYTAEKAKSSYTVQIKLIATDGTVLAESGVETVEINSSFWARLIAFFHLFLNIPFSEIEQ